MCLRDLPAQLTRRTNRSVDAPDQPAGDITQLLRRADQNDPQAAEQILVLVYDELRRLAAARMARESANQTLQPTALVHEAWLRLGGDQQPVWQNRAHFFAAAAEAMRRILIDRERRRLAQRHGGGYERVDLDENRLAAPDTDEQLLAIDEALEKLAREYPQQAQVVKLRYFAGMTNEETAQLLGLSVSTIKNYWAFSRAWLFDQIRK